MIKRAGIRTQLAKTIIKNPILRKNVGIPLAKHWAKTNPDKIMKGTAIGLAGLGAGVKMIGGGAKNDNK